MQTEVLKKIAEFVPLSNEQISNLQNFINFVLAENQKINLIGESTINDIWNRHVLDSAQLFQFIKNKSIRLADLGSGAGFPGIILSILGISEVHLIEKSFRKCEFLERAQSFSPGKIFIHQDELAKLRLPKFDIITARAFAPLNSTLPYLSQLMKSDGYALFLKGKSFESELALAKNHFRFSYDLYPSLTSDESRIIKIYNLK